MAINKDGLTKQQWNTALDRYLSGEELVDIHKSYETLITLPAFKMRASRQGWKEARKILKSKVNSLIKTDEHIEQMAKKGLVATIEDITLAKQERITITGGFIQLVKNYLTPKLYVWDTKSGGPPHWRQLHPGEKQEDFPYAEEKLPMFEPKDINSLVKALESLFTIQRTEFGEASFISETRNLNVNLDVESKKAKVEDMKQKLIEYEHQNS